MTAWKRWQDYIVMAAGVLLFISPLVFGETSQRVATAGAYVLGVLLFLAGVLGESIRESRGIEVVPAVIGVIAFISPWVLGFTAVTGVAWAAWVLGVIVVLAAGHRLFRESRRPAVA